MRNFILVIMSGIIFIFCSSILFTVQPNIVLADDVQGNQDSDFAIIKKQLEIMEEVQGFVLQYQ